MNKSLSILQESGGDSSCCSGAALNIRPDAQNYTGSFRGRAALVTLGCAKNQVDSEVMLGVLRNNGYEIVNELERADVAIVNTCGFLESSAKESIDAILSVAEHKEAGTLRKLIVAGCLVERYKEDLKKTLPEVDDFILTSDLLKIADVASGRDEISLLEAGRPYFLYDDTMPRQLATKRHTAYVKVSEGCNRPCTFCIIPKIRGEMRSRSISSVVSEVKALGDQGVREVNLVAQDLTAFGLDTKQGRLIDLLEQLNDIDSIDWVRLLYAYPVGTEKDLLKAIVSLPKICNYLDMPLQHSSERVLKEMRRPTGRYSPRSIVELIKTEAPEVQLRTTFIVGFPGETKEDVDDLESFIRQGHFLNVGVFTYSKEKEAESYNFKNHITKREKERRRDQVMKAQQEVCSSTLQRYVGKKLPVLVEGAHDDTDLLLVGRSAFQAPEVDGVVIINDSQLPIEEIQTGAFATVEITEVAGYDLLGNLISLSPNGEHHSV